MIQNNSRIEVIDKHGILFYEQDILYDNNIYNKDIEINFTIDYVSPGFGIALFKRAGDNLTSQKEMYLFKIGQRAAEVIYKNGHSQKTMKKSSISLAVPIEDLKLTFKITNKKVSIYSNSLNLMLIDYTIPNSTWNKYSFGIYSNKGNIVKDMYIISSIPRDWTVNMYNTNGGYIEFIKNGFNLTNCKNNAEIEQGNIELEAGTYRLQYSSENNSDIKAYILKDKDYSTMIKSKNILKGGYFTLDKTSKVTLRFVGKNGTIKNIKIVESLSIETERPDLEFTSSKASLITANTNGVSIIEWNGTISSLGKNYFYCSNNVEYIKMTNVFLESNKTYFMRFNVDYNVFTIHYNDTLIFTYNFYNSTNIFKFFYDLDGKIENLTVTMSDGTVIKNPNLDMTKKIYVDKFISSPIVIVDEDNEPLDLSSSYRTSEKEGYTKYIFTNTERELFEPSSLLTLEKECMTDSSKIHVYGIPKDSKVNFEYFYDDNLARFCNNYQEFNNNQIIEISKETKEIFLDNIVENYQYIIVDYKKKDSYCINYSLEKDSYEVDISSDKNTVLMYDKITISNGTINMNDNFILTENDKYISPRNKEYIVLKKNIEEE